MLPSPTVSVVTVNYRGADDTIDAVRNVLAVGAKNASVEVIVVENGSGDDSLQRLRTEFASTSAVRVIDSGANLGFTGGSNLGAREAQGDFVAFLNNDARPEAHWIDRALERFTESPKIAAVASKVLDFEGRTVDFVRSGLTWFGMGFKDHVGEVDNGQFDHDTDLLFGTGSALLVRRDVFLALGGFDEDLFMFYDDVDLGWRLNLAGYRVRYAADSVVRHKHHGSMRSFGAYRELYLLERNALMLLYKNLSDEHLATFLPAALGLVARRAVAKSGKDSTQYDLRKFTNAEDEHDALEPIAKDALAGLFAIDQWIESLGAAQSRRDQVQSLRRVDDAEIFRKFGDAFTPLFDHPSFLAGKKTLERVFRIPDAFTRRRVLVITGDSIGEKMAGPALRAWKIAEVLSKIHDVRLISWNAASRRSDDFVVERVRIGNERDMAVHEQWADVIVFQGHARHHFSTIQRSKKITVVDIYDPMHIEQLEQGREWGTPTWRAHVAGANNVLNEQLLRGDFFLCASERQRLFWLGQLAGLGRVNPDTYMGDPNLSNLIGIAPFGMDASFPAPSRPALRGVVPGIDAEDKVILWGGGLYNWFDAETLVRAVAVLAETRPNIRLFFLGTRHPNPDVPEMAIVGETRELARSLGVLNKNVFFNENWVALDDRHNYLAEADLGVSTHREHIETTLSFRTRILDYLWAGLPIVSTEGDSFGDLITKEGLGESVPAENVDALAGALETYLFNEDAIASAREQVQRVRSRFYWDEALRDLIDFCNNPRTASDRPIDLPSTQHKEREQAARSAFAERIREARSSEEIASLYHEIGTQPKSFSRDLNLARFYLQHEGAGGLGRRMLSRLSPRARRSQQ